MAQRLLDAAGAAALAVAVSLAVHVAIHCPVQPVGPPPTRPPAASAAARFPPNNLLQNLEKLGEGQLNAPEDVYVDAGGEVYTGTRDGWVRRMRGNGSWERWGLVGGLGLLGIAPSADGAMLVCDADKASDGTVYFSDASTRFNFDNWFQDFLEYRFTGRLLKYDPRTGKASVVLDGLGFANGVALPPDEAFVVVCETMKFRCLRVWLKGEKAGEAEIFVDNLPGNPDNIRLGSDGEVSMAGPDLPLELDQEGHRFVPIAHREDQGDLVAQVSLNGEIMRVLGDSEGKMIDHFTSVTEFNGDLFLGSLATNFIGKISLAKVPHEQEYAVPS
uniref:Strictosidine synthase conserved region domain-containing protein n=1 Tax=Oryza punctata TaxID=4537 RepID=A0A0E0LN95_ORYPU